MNTANILSALKQERDRINAAIVALSGGTEGHGKRRSGRRPKRRLSAAARKRISVAAKARWAKAKKAGKSSL
jgi:hypothetical protein